MPPPDSSWRQPHRGFFFKGLTLASSCSPDDPTTEMHHSSQVYHDPHSPNDSIHWSTTSASAPLPPTAPDTPMSLEAPSSPLAAGLPPPPRLPSPTASRSSKASDDREDDGDQLHGRWTREEHEMFLNCLSVYGHEWKKMEAAIKTRTSIQIRSHAQKYFLRMERKTHKGGAVSNGAKAGGGGGGSGGSTNQSRVRRENYRPSWPAANPSPTVSGVYPLAATPTPPQMSWGPTSAAPAAAVATGSGAAPPMLYSHALPAGYAWPAPPPYMTMPVPHPHPMYDYAPLTAAAHHHALAAAYGLPPPPPMMEEEATPSFGSRTLSLEGMTEDGDDERSCRTGGDMTTEAEEEETDDEASSQLSAQLENRTEAEKTALWVLCSNRLGAGD